MLTFLPLEQIDEMDKWEGSELNKAKEILAFELTKLVHGEEEATKAQEAARAIFAGAGNSQNMPSTVIEDADLSEDGTITVLAMMIKAGLIKSNGEGRRLIQQGGISVNDEKMTDPFMAVNKDDLANEVIVKKGKKVYHKFTV